jgi:rhamnose transport system permease protein
MKLEHHRREISLVLAIVLLAAVLSVLAPGFFSGGNLRDLLMANLPVLIAAIGITLVILTGQIDISVGSQFAICSVIAGAVSKIGIPVPLAGAAACLAGSLLGMMNGALVSYARIPSIVVTLATMVALRDGLRWATEGAWVQDLPASFQWFGRSQAVSEAITAGSAAVFLISAAWSLRHLGGGRAVYATGSNRDAARLAGIDPARVVFWVFTLAGALTGSAAFFNAVRFNQVPSNAGVGMEMQVIASVIVGGTTVTGGKGTLAGTLLGVILLGMIGPALTFLGISPYWERAIQGGIILAAVAIDAIRGRAGGYAGKFAVERA